MIETYKIVTHAAYLVGIIFLLIRWKREYGLDINRFSLFDIVLLFFWPLFFLLSIYLWAADGISFLWGFTVWGQRAEVRKEQRRVKDMNPRDRRMVAGHRLIHAKSSGLHRKPLLKKYFESEAL